MTEWGRFRTEDCRGTEGMQRSCADNCVPKLLRRAVFGNEGNGLLEVVPAFPVAADLQDAVKDKRTNQATSRENGVDADDQIDAEDDGGHCAKTIKAPLFPGEKRNGKDDVQYARNSEDIRQARKSMGRLWDDLKCHEAIRKHRERIDDDHENEVGQ